MQGASASCHRLRGQDLDPGPQEPPFSSSESPSSPFPYINRPSVALELYDRFVSTQTNTAMETDETENDATMTVTTNNQSFVPAQSLPSVRPPGDDSSDIKVRKRGNSPSGADTSARNKKVSIRDNSADKPASPVALPTQLSSQSDSSAPNAALAFRYHSRDKPPFIVQVQPLQESDSINLHPLHISRILSQIHPRGVLEIKKTGRNRILAQMSTYEAANRLLDDKSLAARNLKAFVPTHRILRTGVIRDVPQDFTIEMLKESIASPVKVIDIHRLNRRTKIDNEIKYSPSRTVCIKFSGQLLPNYVYLYNCRYSVSPYIPKARICFNCFKVGHVSKTCKGKSRCVYCGNDKHASTSSNVCSSAQPPYSCINCSGDHLATSHLCPEVIRHKMVLSLASTQNIPYSEARKSVFSHSSDSSSPQLSDPRFDFRNFPNLPNHRSNLTTPNFETYNRFSVLQNYGNNPPPVSPPQIHSRLPPVENLVNPPPLLTTRLNNKRYPLAFPLPTGHLNPPQARVKHPFHHLSFLRITMMY